MKNRGNLIAVFLGILLAVLAALLGVLFVMSRPPKLSEDKMREYAAAAQEAGLAADSQAEAGGGSGEVEHFYREIAPLLEKQSQRIAHRNLKRELGEISFHHIGVATREIEKELPLYTLMGYEKESGIFEDHAQGIRGLFLIAKDQPRLELLENLVGSHTLDEPLMRGQKLYHTAYYVENIEKAVEVFFHSRAKMISPLKQSTYFGKRICFLMLPNMSLIELMEL